MGRLYQGPNRPRVCAPSHDLPMKTENLLKRDVLGSISTQNNNGRMLVIRDTSPAPRVVRGLARALARREALALEALDGLAGIPEMHAFDGKRLSRSFLPGDAMHRAIFEPKSYFRSAFRLLRLMHGRGIVHNDLAKEANWICMPGNQAGIVDFQLARVKRRRGALLRLLAHEDLRHLLKHKRHYCPELLTARELRILAQPTVLALLWRGCVKPPYRFVTRRLLGWVERPNAEERGHRGQVRHT